MFGNDVYVFANFASTATLPDGSTVTSGGLRDNLLFRLDAAGSLVGRLTSLGEGDELAFALAVQTDGTVGAVGTFNAPALSFGTRTLPTNAQASFIAIAGSN